MKLLVRKKLVKNSGAALVELALVITFLLTILVVLFELALCFNNYLYLNKAVRESARVASTLELLTVNDPRVIEVFNDRFSYLGSVSSISVTNTDASILTSITSAAGSECAREVQVVGQFTQNFTFTQLVWTSSINIKAKANMRYLLQPLCS